jgi:hypothetical protein
LKKFAAFGCAFFPFKNDGAENSSAVCVAASDPRWWRDSYGMMRKISDKNITWGATLQWRSSRRTRKRARLRRI